ncbi:MAG: hypothetical protein FWH06_04960, partial [Oscillospiraceae bacterium]|nr:hypothetical protein [Oscillospiraceae bacterium]
MDTTVYAVDKPYDYRASMPVAPGQRVLVPFGRGNRMVEAMVLAVSERSEKRPLKPVARILDELPVVDGYGLKLALWMNDRFYCTVYEALRAMLPAGLWYRRTETVSLAQPFAPDASWPLVEHDQELTRGLELLVQSGNGLPIDEWQSVMGAKWQPVLQALGALGLARAAAEAKK